MGRTIGSSLAEAEEAQLVLRWNSELEGEE
jgi:hypothetical protein